MSAIAKNIAVLVLMLVLFGGIHIVQLSERAQASGTVKIKLKTGMHLGNRSAD